ncbi:unnamed protein product [Orchesella dallaii]|uniref:Gustatory receptor n=1 Tax=Orchesella dallaii TaxID=48710 RepID=A0ABP1R749_9HEXA
MADTGNAYSLPQKIRSELYQLSKIGQTPCKWLGLSVHSLDIQNELHFSWQSIPVFLAILRFCIVRIAGLFYVVSEDEFRQTFNSASTTEYFSETLFAYTITVTDVVTLLLHFRNRYKFVHFQSQLNTFLVELSTQFNILKGEDDVVTAFKGSIKNSIDEVKWLRNVVLGCTAILIIGSEFSVIGNLLQHKPLSTLTWKTVGLVPFAFCWSFQVMSRLFIRIWMIGLIYSLKIGGSIVTDQLNNIELLRKHNIDCFSKDQILEMILNKFSNLEELLCDFNRIFGVHIALDLLSLTVIVFANVFQAVVWYKNPEQDGVFAFGLCGIVSSLMIFSFCDSANKVELQERAFINSLEKTQLSGFSNDLHMQTKVASFSESETMQPYA